MRFHRPRSWSWSSASRCSAARRKEEPAPPVAPAPEVSTAPASRDGPHHPRLPCPPRSTSARPWGGQKVTDPATTFGPKDTIYASVATEGTAPAVKLHAKWT